MIEIKNYKQGGLCANYIEAGDGRAVHFAHANGFPTGAYRPIIDELARDYRVLGLNVCGQNSCERPDCTQERRQIDDWHRLAADLEGFLSGITGGERVVGAGHDGKP